MHHLQQQYQRRPFQQLWNLCRENMGAALMKQDKTVSNRGVQHYQHRLHTTSRQDNPVGKGYLT